MTYDVIVNDDDADERNRSYFNRKTAVKYACNIAQDANIATVAIWRGNQRLWLVEN